MDMSESRGVYSEKIKSRRRIFFYDVLVSSNGDRFLSINETITKEGKHQHSRIIIDERELDDFMFGLNKAVEYMNRDATNKNIEEKTNRPARAGDKWTQPEDQRLMKMFDDGLSVANIAKELCRSTGAIQSRLAKHSRIDSFGNIINRKAE
jgi:hypothetical protein